MYEIGVAIVSNYTGMNYMERMQVLQEAIKFKLYI